MTAQPSPAHVHLWRQGAFAAFGRLFDCLPELQVWIKDRQGRYCWVNRAFLLDYCLDQPAQAIGRTDYDLSPQHLADQFRLDDERVLAGNEIRARIELVGRFDHSACWCVTHKTPVLDRDGRIVAVAGVSYALRDKDPAWDSAGVGLGKLVAHIREHMAESITNHDLARLAGLSVRALERKFRKAFGCSPRQYIRTIRVRLACRALVDTHRPLGVIAAQFGFADQSHFTRDFRAKVGETPRRYRRLYQAE